MDINLVTERIIGAAIEVHRVLGPGLLESVYQECMCYELSKAGLQFRKQVQLPIRYKEVTLESELRLDLLVEECVVVELKAVEHIIPVFQAQLLTQLKLTGKKIGLLINFNVPVLKQGLVRMVNNL
ncbi:MAG: GxxExxY protein [Planctomycetes bacterium]|nr:GxxExxY protein [Planctomycetota bacterium]